MRKLLFISILLNLCIIVYSQEYIKLNDGTIRQGEICDSLHRTIEYVDNGILVTYQFDNVIIEKDPIFPASKLLLINGFGIREGSGIPALPINEDRFVIHTNIFKVSIIDSSYIEVPVEISPARPPVPNGLSPVFTLENVKGISPFVGFYPHNVISTTPNKYKSDIILNICINPIQYDYQSKITRIYKKISYLINYNDEDKAVIKNKKDKDPYLSNISINLKNIKKEPNRATSQITPPEYLIITVPQYEEAVSNFAEWKKTLGYNVRVCSHLGWNETSVKDTIIAINSISPIAYLLIVGDFEDVPGKAISDSFQTSSGLTYYNFYTDYYYGCIQQNEYPEIRRGRLPVSSPALAMSVVEKIIQYEKEPIIDSVFYRTGLNCAFFQDRFHYNNFGQAVTPGDSVEDVRFTLTSENIRDFLITECGKDIYRVYKANDNVTPYYWNDRYYGYYQIKTPIPMELRRTNGFMWDGSQNDIIEHINNGTFYVLHRDHGAIQRWADPSFGFSGIDSLTNGNKLPVVFSMNCLTGRYSNDTCFAEKFLRKANGGCVAIFAASEESFSGYNDALTLGMFDALWPSHGFFKSFPRNYSISLSSTPSYKLGDILDIGLAKISTLYNFWGNDALTHTKEIFHCFGDPTMEMYTDMPTPFDTLSVTMENNQLSIILPTEATITFYNLSTGLTESFKGTNVSYPYSENLRICISAHNKIPAIIESDILCIQNETIAHNVDYEVDTIKVGSNVTSFKKTGEVIITGGVTKLKGKNIELSNGTTVMLGAGLEISN